MRRRTLLGGWATSGSALLVACSLSPDLDHRDDDAPRTGPLLKTGGVAWVFGSGGPRGFVHVGVLKALEELDLRPQLIVGASVGALVGALCAAGWRADAIEELALGIQPWQLARWSPRSDEPYAGAPLAAWVRKQVGERRIEALPLPLAIAVQRLSDGAVVGFTRGDVGLAVQASAAVEGQFAPVRILGERYADADLRMPLPVRLARELGATRVLAVDASAHEDRAPSGAERFREADLRKRALTRPDAEAADLVLHPDIGYWAGLSREYRERLIRVGHEQTLIQADKLRALYHGLTQGVGETPREPAR